MAATAHVENQLPALALGSLEPQERERVLRHLRSCPACRALQAGYEELVGELGLAAPQREPPRGLRRRIRRRVPRSAVPAPRRAGLWGLAAAALLALLAVSIGLNLALWRRVDRLEALSAALPGRFAVLAGTEAAAEARGLLLFASGENEATLVVEDLPPLDSGRQYQLWLIREGRRTSGGGFSVTAQGYGCLLILAPLPLGSYQALGITVEPEGGSPGPTGRRVLGGSL